jgi:hypothetical protein
VRRGNWQQVGRVVARVGVVAAVAVACLLGAGRLDDAVAVFDFRADANAAASYRERTYPESTWVAGAAEVIEDARLWMPGDAAYRVIHGPRFSLDESSGYGRYFLLTRLLPRTQTASESAPWVFCYGCSRATLGPRYEVLSESREGFLFARRRA